MHIMYKKTNKYKILVYTYKKYFSDSIDTEFPNTRYDPCPGFLHESPFTDTN